MDVFVTGAAGFIGGSVAHRLLEAGHRVRGLVRSPERAEQLAARRIAPVLGTLDDAQLLLTEARRADAVINAANADHRASVVSLIKGLEGTGKPFIHTSGSSVVGDDAEGETASDSIFDEDTPFVIAPQKRERREIDLAVVAAMHSGLRSCVICPSNIYGIGRGLNKDSVQIPLLVENARRMGVVEVVGSGSNRWSDVHIDDLAALYLLALEAAPPGAFYFAENGESSFRELATAIATRLGLGPVAALPVNDAIERWGAKTARFTLGSNSRVRAKRAREELHWTPAHSSATQWILSEMPL